MKKILSIQSHVTYGYVGNKAAVYPLQYMGHDVLPINTVQFSNHTGYGKWKGEIFSSAHIKDFVQGLIEIDQFFNCHALLSGYMGSREICDVVFDTARSLKAKNPDFIHLCDPVIGVDGRCYVKPDVADFFKKNLCADIITPNQYEAETLSGIKITDTQSLKQISDFFHKRSIKTVIITGIKLNDLLSCNLSLMTYISDGEKNYVAQTKAYPLKPYVSGTGDLFSALYLGYFLKKRNANQAFQQTLYHLDCVLRNTSLNNTDEICVIGHRYDTADEQWLPLLKEII